MRHDLPIRANRPKPRLTSLDAVRGIASCSVVLWHSYLILPEQTHTQLAGSFWANLLMPLINGNAAVVIFFTLSGYVLSLPYWGGKQLPYAQYVIRRLTRIYLPFAASIMIALALFAATDHLPTAGASHWFNEIWPSSWPSGTVIAGHFLMVGTGQDMQLNSPMWTLVYEMRLSLAFPLLILLCRTTRLAIVVSLALLAGSVASVTRLGQVPNPSYATAFWATLLWTASVVPYFVTGILLSKHRALIELWFSRTSAIGRAFLFAVPYVVFRTWFGFASLMGDLSYDLAAGLVIVLAVESHWLRTLLDTTVPQFLGRISYSLYLIHLPLMLVLVPLLLGRVPFAAIIVTVLAVSIVAATLMHEAVEKPAIQLGHYLTASSRDPVIRPA